MPPQVPDRDEWFPTIDAFPRPDWPAIRGWKRAWISKDDLEEATRQITRHWLERVRAALGGTYSVLESDHFHFLSTLDEKGRTRMLQFLENARTRLRQTLSDVARADGIGKHVVLRFTDLDDYYAYIAHYYADGEHATSGGVFLWKGYSHIAYFEQLTMDSERATLAHEFTHNILVHLPLPPWLNEALAEAFDADLAGGRFAAVDRDLHAEHRTYWNPETIQSFWRGRSFHTVEGPARFLQSRGGPSRYHQP